MGNKEWIAIIKENYNELVEKGIEAYMDSIDGSGFNGWIHEIIINKNGEVYGGYYSVGSFETEVYENNAIVVASFRADSGSDYSFEDDIKDYEIEDMEEFKKYLMEKYCIDENDENFENELDEEITFNNYREFNPEKYDEFYKEDFETYICNYASEHVGIAIDEKIEELEED